MRQRQQHVEGERGGRHLVTVEPDLRRRQALARAAATKFDLACSNGIDRLISGNLAGTDRISPIHSAALAISSVVLGPDGRTRFSMRRCGTGPSGVCEMP